MLVNNMFFYVRDIMEGIIKSIIEFHCVVGIRCLTCGVAHNTPIVEDEETPSR